MPLPDDLIKEAPPGGDQHLPEERRLFYVAITRARERLFLSYAQMRTIFGSQQVNLPSEFLADIDDSLITTGKTPLISIDF